MANSVVHPFFSSCSSTEQQREIWMAAQISADANRAFNETMIAELTGVLDRSALVAAVKAVVSHHDIVRAAFSEDGRTLNRVPPESVLQQCAHVDLTVAAVAEFANRQHSEPFALDGPLLRLHLLAHSPRHHSLLLTCHSLIGGIETLKLLSQDILKSLSRHSSQLSPGSAIDFADWECGDEGRKLKAISLAYWTNKLQGSAPFLELPLDKPRPPEKTFQALHSNLVLDPAIIQRSAVNNRGPWETRSVLMAAYAAFMHRLTGQADILFGSTVTLDLPGGKRAAGAGSKLLPLKISVAGTESFAELVGRVTEEMRQAKEHRYAPFSELLKEVQFHRDASRPVLVSTAFDVVDLPGRTVGDLNVEPRLHPNQFEHLDMRWTVEIGAEIRLKCVFDRELWRQESVDMRLQEFATLLDSALREPDTNIADLDLVPAAEMQRLLQVARGPVRNAPAGDLVSLLHLPRFADRTAVICGNDSLSYRQLEDQSNQLARHLIALGVGPDDLVGVFVERSVGMLVSLLAIWKAGAAYVALDPNYPADRLLYMAQTAQLRALITETGVAAGLESYHCPRVYLDRDAGQVAAYPSSAPVLRNSGPGATAYVIFTSGSTGQPKGVQITHGGVINFLVAMAQRPGLAIDDRFLAVTTLSFDIAIMELCLPLLVGGRVIIARREEALDGYRLLELIDEHRINVMQATPTTWRWMLAAGWQGQDDFKVLCGGEPFPLDLARQLLPWVAEVWNLYGPTEASVWSTCHQISMTDDLDASCIPVGRPADNTQCYILDDRMQLLPHGVPGELYIGGDGVANGYIGQPEKTAAVFISNPIDKTGRLYRTGDQARWRLDGNFECLGRLDGQIKLRGYRIELGEIEAALAADPSVLECAVKVVSYSQSDQRLVAYLKLADGAMLNSSDLRRHARKFLPDYMVPQLFVEMDALPLTPNGKIDRKSLPHPDPAQVDNGNHEPAPPSNETERRLLAIWSDLLKKECESVDQLFFDAGGHSLLAMDMIAIIQQQFGVRLHVLDILVSTAEQIAATVEHLVETREMSARDLILEPS